MQCKLVETSMSSALIATAGDCCVVSECQVEVRSRPSEPQCTHLYSWILGHSFYINQIIANSVSKFPNFSYHGNKRPSLLKIPVSATLKARSSLAW